MKCAYLKNIKRFLRKIIFNIFPSLYERETGRHNECMCGHWSGADLAYTPDRNLTLEFDLLTVHLSTILVIDQLNAQILVLY